MLNRQAQSEPLRGDEMGKRGGYRTEPFGGSRRMVAAAAASGRQSDTIHLMTEVDISGPRRLIAEYRERTGLR